jgi:hypothetical protein
MNSFASTFLSDVVSFVTHLRYPLSTEIHHGERCLLCRGNTTNNNEPVYFYRNKREQTIAKMLAVNRHPFETELVGGHDKTTTVVHCYHLDSDEEERAESLVEVLSRHLQIIKKRRRKTTSKQSRLVIFGGKEGSIVDVTWLRSLALSTSRKMVIISLSRQTHTQVQEFVRSCSFHRPSIFAIAPKSNDCRAMLAIIASTCCRDFGRTTVFSLKEQYHEFIEICSSYDNNNVKENNENDQLLWL